MNLPNEIQYEIITALGGPKSVAAEIDESMATVANWRVRGISARCKPIISALAQSRGIAVPDDFFGEKVKAFQDQ